MMERHKEGSKRKPRTSGAEGRNHSKGTTGIIEENIIFLKTFDQMGLSRSALRTNMAPFHGVVSDAMSTLIGQITLSVTLGKRKVPREIWDKAQVACGAWALGCMSAEHTCSTACGGHNEGASKWAKVGADKRTLAREWKSVKSQRDVRVLNMFEPP
jgi:hypothetical protein